MASSNEINHNIATTSEILTSEGKLDDVNPITVAWWNIANAKRDEDMNPLADRLDMIIDQIKKNICPDVLVLLEAGRPSKGMTWTEIAGKIEKETGLFYFGIRRINATLMSFGKAVFYNPKTIALDDLNQFWTKNRSGKWSGDHFGNDMLVFDAHPVIDNKVVVDKRLSIAAVHFPMKYEARIQVSQFVRNCSHNFDVVGGDFNTFADDGGKSMIEIITASECVDDDHNDYALQEMLDESTKMTFKAFDHDVVEVPNHKLPKGFSDPENDNTDTEPYFTIIEQGPETSKVLFRSWLDHIFATKHLIKRAGESNIYTQVGEITPASDHAWISIHIMKWQNL